VDVYLSMKEEKKIAPASTSIKGLHYAFNGRLRTGATSGGAVAGGRAERAERMQEDEDSAVSRDF